MLECCKELDCMASVFAVSISRVANAFTLHRTTYHVGVEKHEERLATALSVPETTMRLKPVLPEPAVCPVFMHMIDILLAGDKFGARVQSLETIQNAVRSLGMDEVWHWASQLTSSPTMRSYET